jgi:hypothetical protein
MLELVCEVEVKVVVQRAVVMKATKITAIGEVCIVELASDLIDRWNKCGGSDTTETVTMLLFNDHYICLFLVTTTMWLPMAGAGNAGGGMLRAQAFPTQKKIGRQAA